MAWVAARPPAPSLTAAVSLFSAPLRSVPGMRGACSAGALSVAANIVRVRLFDRLREEEGATYSPSATHSASQVFSNWGILYAAAEVRPDRVPVFFRVARETVADLAARPALADEFARAQNPVVSGIQRRLSTNGYWLTALEGFVGDPARIAEVRSYLADYRGMTAEDVRRAVAAHVADAGDWSMIVLPARAPAASAAPPATAPRSPKK